ncbi:hypothetical protein HNS38_04615 [Lentimicrobium sp. L6]|uniref:hypothetical protein n=1 Tax=Lentimicrobium sp. L6 TaxID=2735916 RepID=UPI00155187C0|nr:hypothetical protein [Lentimicrobium sp. L6]NPD84028.1 hypothetical protein [Lentimicrobium sp. L6]
MKTQKITQITLLLFLLLATNPIFSQGCSDAGVCSVTQQFDAPSSKKLAHHFSLTPSIGLGDQQSWILGSVISYQIQNQKGWSFGLALPYSTTFGNIATTSGIGDIILSLNAPLFKNADHQVSWLIAGKIATGDANKLDQGMALPMIYQQSSGTNDLITSLQWNFKTWLFAAGYQHAFNTTENTFLSSDFLLDSDAAKYHSSAYLKRGDDVMVRFEKRFQGKKKSSFKAGVLPIFRIQADEIKVNDEYQEIANSTGLTLNLYTAWRYQFSEQFYTELQLAAPPITREVRADGTTRSFLLNLRMAFSL